MKSWLLKVIPVLIGIIVLATAIPLFGEDFLVIRKKGGPTQKVPLQFSPEEIDSFHVEPATPGVAQPKRPSAPDQDARDAGEEDSEERAKPMDIRPGTQPPAMIPRTGPAQPSPAPPRAAPRQPGAEQDAMTREPAREPIRQVMPAPPPPRSSVSGSTSVTAPGGAGTFSVNVFELPENIQALPDFSALRPVQTLTTDRIDLDPAQGRNEPAGITVPTDRMGLRFMGMFMVSGEGIFRWRVQAKDGVRLHIDDKTVIESDGIREPTSKVGFVHLSEGPHIIVLDSFNSKGAPVVKLFLTPPTGPEQAFSIGTGVAGWQEPAKPYDVLWGQVYFVPKGNYPTGPDFSKISPIGRLTNAELNIAGGEGFPGLPGRRDMVGIRYQGFFKVDGAGIFAFRLLADNFARLTIGKHVIAETTKGVKAEPQGKLGWAFLQQGSYPIILDYFHPEGEPRLQLYVTQPEKEEELFSPQRTLTGYSSDEGRVPLIPAFVYFLKPGTKEFPNFNKMSPSGMFFSKAIDYPLDRGTKEFPGVPRRDEWLGLRFYVKFTLGTEEAGQYKFRIVAKDSARLIIGKKMVVNAGGPGRMQDQVGVADLPAGGHEMFLDYMHTTGPNGLQLFITPPRGEEKIFAFQ